MPNNVNFFGIAKTKVAGTNNLFTEIINGIVKYIYLLIINLYSIVYIIISHNLFTVLQNKNVQFISNNNCFFFVFVH